MGKLLTAVLAIAVLAGASWYALNRGGQGPAMDGSSAGPGAGPSAPKRELDNVRGAASRIESDADQRARDLESQTAQ